MAERKLAEAEAMGSLIVFGLLQGALQQSLLELTIEKTDQNIEIA